MKGMILAAGFGTRLVPLTLKRPKVLVPVANIPVIDRVIDYLKTQGISEIVINAHHLASQVVEYLDEGRGFGVKLQVRVENEILGTGGGIRNTADFWDQEPFVVINGDILTDVPLTRVYEEHCRNGVLATLVLHNSPPYRQLRVDSALRVVEIGDEDREERLAFTGIHIIDPRLLGSIPEGVFSDIIDCYREMIRQGREIRAYVAEAHAWQDIGTIESYFKANRDALRESPLVIGKGSVVHPSARIKQWAVIGENTQIQRGAEIERSILWENVTVKEGKSVKDSIVTSFKEVDRDLAGEIL